MNDDALKNERTQLVSKLRQYFQDERDEELGELPAKMMLDFIEREIAPFFYNRGVRDAKSKTIAAFATLAEEMDYLEILVPKKPGARPSRE
ncbi:MAG: hypothetical protein JWP91_1247 [Fibrobacteres bacterium]|nr:hypothetical protein [Fibrobacterota bacterium]